VGDAAERIDDVELAGNAAIDVPKSTPFSLEQQNPAVQEKTVDFLHFRETPRNPPTEASARFRLSPLLNNRAIFRDPASAG